MRRLRMRSSRRPAGAFAPCRSAWKAAWAASASRAGAASCRLHQLLLQAGRFGVCLLDGLLNLRIEVGAGIAAGLHGAVGGLFQLDDGLAQAVLGGGLLPLGGVLGRARLGMKFQDALLEIIRRRAVLAGALG